MDAVKIMNFGTKIQKLINKKNLSRDEIYELFEEVFLNEQPDLQQGVFFATLVAKEETVDAIVGGAWAAIDEIDTVYVSSHDIQGDLFENCGTWMDALKTFNVSSAAAGGVTMASLGARAITSRCETVDILEKVGIDVECDIRILEKSIKEPGIGIFNGMRSKVHSGALGRILSQIRFVSTLNIPASLANPCRPKLGLRSVYSEKLLPVAA